MCLGGGQVCLGEARCALGRPDVPWGRPGVPWGRPDVPWGGQVCLGEARCALGGPGVPWGGQMCLGEARCALGRPGVPWGGQVCLGRGQVCLGEARCATVALHTGKSLPRSCPCQTSGPVYDKVRMTFIVQFPLHFRSNPISRKGYLNFLQPHDSGWQRKYVVIRRPYVLVYSSEKEPVGA